MPARIQKSVTGCVHVFERPDLFCLCGLVHVDESVPVTTKDAGHPSAWCRRCTKAAKCRGLALPAREPEE